MEFGSRHTLSARESDFGDYMVAKVKRIDTSPDSKYMRVRVRQDGARWEDSIYVPRKFANNMKPERKYQFHLEEVAYRGSGQSRLTGVSMSRRTRSEPLEVTSSGFGGKSKGGGGYTIK